MVMEFDFDSKTIVRTNSAVFCANEPDVHSAGNGTLVQTETIVVLLSITKKKDPEFRLEVMP